MENENLLVPAFNLYVIELDTQKLPFNYFYLVCLVSLLQDFHVPKSVSGKFLIIYGGA